MSTVHLKGINKSFGTNHVLRDVNLAVEDGEFVVIVGPSGCGKSTLLRVVAGLETPDSGTVELDGVVVNDAAPAKRDISMVFQTYALYPHMTVARNLAFGLKRLKLEPEQVNTFVGSFLGTPAMNFVGADLLSIHGATSVGLRPEYLRIARDGRINGKVVHFERLGSDTHLIVGLSTGQKLTANLKGQLEFERGADVSLDFDDADAVLFDEDGWRVGVAAPTS